MLKVVARSVTEDESATEAESISPSKEPLNEPLKIAEPKTSKEPVISTELEIEVLEPVIWNILPVYFRFSSFIGSDVP